MTLEQKAKAYDEAIEKAKDMLSYGEMRREDVEHLFPSLIESEEDRIRVAITRFLLKNGKYAIEMYGCTIKEATDWLERQRKPQWTVEDEKMFGDVITACCEYYGYFEPWPEIKKWLESIFATN